MDKAIKIAKQKGGLQTFIVPDSFLLGRYFSKIREYILENNEIQNILLLPYSVFKATVGYSVIYLFQKQKDVSAKHLISARYAETNEAIQKNAYKSFVYPQKYFSSLKHNRFRLYFDEKAMSLALKIEHDAVELNTVIKFSSGLIGKNGQESITSNSKKSGKWMKGIISGGEIKRYSICPDGYYLLYDKSKIKSGYDCVDYQKDKLFMRQTGDSLICAFDKQGLLALNNVHIGNLINDAYDLKYVVAIINSKLMDYYYKTISLEAGRVMAQTDIETIDGLPIKQISKSEQKPFVELVEKILKITEGKDYLDNGAKQDSVRKIEVKLNKLVYDLYGLTSEEKKALGEM